MIECDKFRSSNGTRNPYWLISVAIDDEAVLCVANVVLMIFLDTEAGSIRTKYVFQQ